MEATRSGLSSHSLQLRALCRKDWRIEHKRPTGHFWNLRAPKTLLLVAARGRESFRYCVGGPDICTSFSGLACSCVLVREGGEHGQQRRACCYNQHRSRGCCGVGANGRRWQHGNTSTYQPVHKATAPPADQPVDMFVTKQAVTEWRACKLVGVSVHGVDDKKVGTIKDVLVDHDGSARVIVIGVDRAKDIGVPFTAIQWQTEGRVVPATDQPPANPFAKTDRESNQPTLKRTDPAATEASQGYPDKAVLRVTLAQLKMAPDFQYAPDPLVELEPPSGGP